ncbi:MAG: transcriptional repressor LexA [Patescibacteria group bacterium]|nr:transcriptional repressor LexA [Patescibacteria group bacterium]
MENTLTKKQKNVLELIYNFLKDSGFPPSLADLKMELGVSSNQAVLNYLVILEKNGYLKREEGLARGIRILSKGFKVLNVEQIAPVVGDSSCGHFVEAISEVGKWISLPGTVWKDDVTESEEKTYIIQVHGDSMINAGIFDGDMLLIKQSREYKNGDIVVARGDDGTTVKRFVYEDKKVFLKPENPSYKNIPFYEDLFLDGKVIANLTTLKRLYGAKNN